MELAIILITCAIIGYLFGSIPNAVLIGKIFFKKDVREYGSKNAGGTNAGRVFGKKVGLIVIILDVLKTTLPVYAIFFTLKYSSLSQYHAEDYGFIISSLFALIGHCFPIFARFRGGKAVSSYLAICLQSNWLFTLIGLVFYVSILKWKKYVSLSSIATSILIALMSIGYSFIPTSFGMILIKNSYYYMALMVISTIILVVKHHENIIRLLNHNERKISWLK